MYGVHFLYKAVKIMMKEDKDIIKRGSSEFMLAIDSSERMQEWWDHNTDAIGVAMVGRSNVGKSSLINTLFGNKTAKTSKTPGRTQKINVFNFKIHGEDTRFFLYDLPGYGHAEVNKEMKKNWEEVMGTFFMGLNNHTAILNIQDARHPHQDSDQQFYKYVNPKAFNIFLVFNKIDKLKTQKERAVLEKLKPEIFKLYKSVKQIFFVSAEKKNGIAALEQAIANYLYNRKDNLMAKETEQSE
jgi:GTP-binding protein